MSSKGFQNVACTGVPFFLITLTSKLSFLLQPTSVVYPLEG